MRWQNIETPTFAGSAGSAGEPAVVETMQLLDRDGNEVVAFTKAVDGTIASTVDGQPKVYRALLTQTGTDAPVATVLENTLGGDVVWTRGLTGIYFGTLAGAFPSGKTYVSPFQYVDPSNGNYQLYRYDDDAVTIESLGGVDLHNAAFAAYFPVPIQILVNP